MGKYDKDRFQKEMAIRFCLAQGLAPFMEVLVFSSSDLSDSSEVLTDLDVLGLEFIGDGTFRRVLFDCKTASKLSPVNRAFWAAGILEYSGCNDAIIILKGKAVHNHRISALKLGVDLHDEKSFEEFGKTIKIDFQADIYYQSTLDRWNALFDIYQKNPWSEQIFSLCHNVVPLTREPWTIFRRIVGAFREARGYLDPAKPGHVTIVFDVLSALSILWSLMGKDMRRFYSAGMSKENFSEILRYYIWGGREAYIVRKELRSKIDDQNTSAFELPAWGKFTNLAGLIITAPQEFFPCSHLAKEISLRKAGVPQASHDSLLLKSIAENKRVMQFLPALVDYLIEACNIPKDFSTSVTDGLQLK